jgi:hypothetical protein
MAMSGVLRPAYIQIRVLDVGAALTHYVDRIGLNLVAEAMMGGSISRVGRIRSPFHHSAAGGYTGHGFCRL